MRSLVVFLNLVILSHLSDGAPLPQVDDVKTTVVDPTTCSILAMKVSDAAVSTAQGGGAPDPKNLLGPCLKSNAVATASGNGAAAGHGGGRAGGLRGDFSSGSADSSNGNPAAYAGTSYYPSSGDPSTTASNPSADGYPPATAEPTTGYGPATDAPPGFGPPPASNGPSSGYPSNGSNGPNSGYPVASGPDGTSYPSTFGPAAPEPANSNYDGATSDFGGSNLGGSGDRTVKSAGDATSGDYDCGNGCANIDLANRVAEIAAAPVVSEASNPMLDSAGFTGLDVPQVSETKTTGCPSGNDVDVCVKGGSRK